MLANGLNLSHPMAAEKLEETPKMDFYANKLSLPSPTGSRAFYPPNLWKEQPNTTKRFNFKAGTLLQSPPAGPLGSLESLRNYFQINISPDYKSTSFSPKNSAENGSGALRDMDLAAVNYRNFYLYHHYLMSIQLHQQQQQAQQAHQQQQSQQSLASELSRLQGIMGEKYYDGKNFTTPKCQPRPVKNNVARHQRKSHPYLLPPTYSRQNCNTTYKTGENFLTCQSSPLKDDLHPLSSNNLYLQRQRVESNKSAEFSDNNNTFRHNDGQVTTLTCPVCKTRLLSQNVSEHFESEFENFKTIYCNGNSKKMDISPVSIKSTESQESPKSINQRTSSLLPDNVQHESPVEILPVIHQIKQTYYKVRNNRKQRLQRNYLMIKSYESTFNSTISEKKDYTISNILNQSHGSSSPHISTVKIEDENTFFQEENSNTSINDKLDKSKTQVEIDPGQTLSPLNDATK